MARLEEKFAQRAQGKPLGAPAFNPLPQQSRDTFTELSVAHIETDPDQPRKDPGDLTELKASIESVGLVQPIIVTIIGYERYRLIAGERRFTAVKELGLSRIPAIVRSVEEQQRLKVQIIENLHRKDLNPFEEARSYQRLMSEFGYTQDELARQLGRSQGGVNETLRLLALPAAVQQEYRTSDKVTKSLLLEIAKHPEEEQLSLWEQAKHGELTVRKAREQKKQSKSSGAKAEPTKPAPMSSRYLTKTQRAVVTVTFDRAKASQEEIVMALEEALATERERLHMALPSEHSARTNGSET
jgi:ParB family chromosome partitioning protein